MKRNQDGDGREARGSLQELKELLEEFDTAMLVTMTPEKLIRARPMALQNPDELGGCDLWFVTGDDTPKADEIGQEHQVCVCCYRSRDAAYVSISALASFEKDKETIRKLWKPDWKAWFPDGPDDPTISLLKLDVERAEYWHPEGGKARVLFDMVRSLITKKAAQEYLPPPKHL